MIHKTSLSETIDGVSDALFNHRTLPADERLEVARWIAGRQGLPAAYADMFAGFPGELEKGILLFTGERITSASARHIVGEEASRALRLLNVRDAVVRSALARADTGMKLALQRAEADPRNTSTGWFCCGKCSVGMWRNLLSGGLDRQEERLRKGAGEVLNSYRLGDGKWHRFPFWYTVLALSEMESAESREELRYAAPVLERTARRAPPADAYGSRRHALAVRALQKV